IYTSGVWSPGATANYGMDFHSNYLNWWLDFIGVSNIETVRFQPSLLTADPAKGFEDALAQVRDTKKLAALQTA
ncbi:MAG: flavodoxin family protein, partial [Rhodospirillales bacterium]|nr:flavodoxin family protein [Rhodospirillales bacterium]